MEGTLLQTLPGLHHYAEALTVQGPQCPQEEIQSSHTAKRSPAPPERPQTLKPRPTYSLLTRPALALLHRASSPVPH